MGSELSDASFNLTTLFSSSTKREEKYEYYLDQKLKLSNWGRGGRGGTTQLPTNNTKLIVKGWAPSALIIILSAEYRDYIYLEVLSKSHCSDGVVEITTIIISINKVYTRYFLNTAMLLLYI